MFKVLSYPPFFISAIALLPYIAVLIAALVFLFKVRNQNPNAVRWAIIGFALLLIQIILVPLVPLILDKLFAISPHSCTDVQMSIIGRKLMASTIFWALYSAAFALCLFRSLVHAIRPA